MHACCAAPTATRLPAFNTEASGQRAVAGPRRPTQQSVPTSLPGALEGPNTLPAQPAGLARASLLQARRPSRTRQPAAAAQAFPHAPACCSGASLLLRRRPSARRRRRRHSLIATPQPHLSPRESQALTSSWLPAHARLLCTCVCQQHAQGGLCGTCMRLMHAGRCRTFRTLPRTTTSFWRAMTTL
jgi:hypothetical protein